jgi:hypothetical protein
LDGVTTLDFETALAACFFAGACAGLRACVFVLAVDAVRLAVTALFGAMLFWVACLAVGDGLSGLTGLDGFDSFAGVADFFALLLTEVTALDLVALRAGAFSAGERLTIGLGRADLSVNARFLAEGVVAVRREAGLEGDLFTPLILGSLMRSSQLSKKGYSKKP